MISIVIPAFNEEKVIADRLALLKGGLRIEHEVIVSDDASADSTVEKARRHADMVLVASTKHHSAAAVRNAGARAARGDLLAFLDADSLVGDPEAFFSHAVARFRNDSGLVGLTAPVRVAPEVETWADRTVFFFLNLVCRVKNNLLGIGEARGKFQMVRASAFRDVGGFREDLVTSEDVDLFVRLSRKGRVRFDPALTVHCSGRRAHAIGWPRLLWIWFRERLHFVMFGTSLARDWTRWWEPGGAVRRQP